MRNSQIDTKENNGNKVYECLLELSDLAESEQSFPALMQVMTRTIEMTRVVFFYEGLNFYTWKILTTNILTSDFSEKKFFDQRLGFEPETFRPLTPNINHYTTERTDWNLTSKKALCLLSQSSLVLL